MAETPVEHTIRAFDQTDEYGRRITGLNYEPLTRNDRTAPRGTIGEAIQSLKVADRKGKACRNT
eukprot:5591911-Amphidinium_carterae.7